MADINSMQANLGLSTAETGSVGIPTPSPADISLRLSIESASRQQQAQQIISSAPLGAPAGFRAQFERQMSMIQAQQSLNPYAAQMFAQQSPQGQQQYLPSPITMTPPSSGVFRPPPPAPAITPLPPVHTPSFQHSPFTPQAPSPMFSSPHEQRIQQQEIRSNRDFSMMSQAPSAIGQGVGILAGAAAGASIGSRFGGWGGVIGAGVGAVAAGASGFAEGLGNIGQQFMKPAIERRTMGAALQNTSRNWVVSGSDVSPLGRGLSQDASNNLAGEIQGLSEDKSFQKQTGGMFNRQDLMKITRQGGEQGLMDMAQDVPQIKQQLKQTATTIKQFMELTNDPDVSNVIRQMGRMRQFGMTQQDMTAAAQGMKTYSRAAGTSIEGLQQIGGLPGAATFQQAGLTAGQGFQYGNFAAASAQQLVAGGGVDPRQLALMGGVQGMAQRDMQGQAAMGSMPMFAAANAQYGAQGWGMGRGGQKAAEGGAFGMVHGALRTMNQAVQRGGIGALATFPLQQREIADKAMAEMTPQEQMAQRFEMAMTTGQRFGMRGEQAFAIGSRVAFGDDVSQQMMYQAKSPGFWKGQRRMLKQRKMELGRETALRAEQEAPSLWGVPRAVGRGLGITGRGSWGEKTADFFDSESGGVGGLGVGEWLEDTFAVDDNTVRTRIGRDHRGVMRSKHSTDRARSAEGPVVGGNSNATDMGMLTRAMNRKENGMVNAMETLADVTTAPIRYARLFGAPAPGKAIQYGRIKLEYTQKQQQEAIEQEMVMVTDSLEIADSSKKHGGTKSGRLRAMEALEKSMGKGTASSSIMIEAAKALDKAVQDSGDSGMALGTKGHKEAVAKGIAKVQKISMKEARKQVEKLEESGGLTDVLDQVRHQATTMTDESTYTDREGKQRKDSKKQIADATEARQDALSKSVVDITEKMDLDGGILGSIFGKSEAIKNVEEIAATGGGKSLALRVAYAEARTGNRDDRSTKRLAELEKDFTTKEREEAEREVLALDDATVKELVEAGENTTTKEMITWGDTQHQSKMQGVWGSQGFMDAVGKYSSKIESVVSKGGGKTLTAQDIGKAFTDKDLQNMARKGGAAGRRNAALLKRAREGDKEAQKLLEEQAEALADVGKDGVEDTAAVKGDGEEAQEVEAADEAMAKMQKMFAGFGPATKDFAFGAKALAEAMDNHEIGKRDD